MTRGPRAASKRRRWRSVLTAVYLAVAVLAVRPAAAVELTLMLAVDASTSVDFREFNLQMNGYSAAFRDQRLHDAIKGHPDGIAVAMMLWSGPRQAETVLKWTIVDGPAAASAFADAIDGTPRAVWGGSTAIAQALEYAVREIEASGIPTRRRVIDVSGDGKSNDGGLPLWQRDRAVAKGITINGLAILNEEPDLREYYEKYVIGGTQAFVESVWTFEDFADAILRKLIREIQGSPLADREPGAAESR